MVAKVPLRMLWYEYMYGTVSPRGLMLSLFPDNLAVKGIPYASVDAMWMAFINAEMNKIPSIHGLIYSSVVSQSPAASPRTPSPPIGRARGTASGFHDRASQSSKNATSSE